MSIPMPDGIYDVIVIDPPWPMKKIRRKVRPRQIAMDYATMPLAEIAAIKLPAANDCQLFCWTTQKFLPKVIDGLLERWGFEYMLSMVWRKPGGFQPWGLPQYNVEFVVHARKGNPPAFTEMDICFNAPRGVHSEKPEAFYEIIRRNTTGRRIDMFARQTREGFTAWGDEVGKLNPAA